MDHGVRLGHDDMCPKPEGPDFDFAAATILATASDGRDFILAAQKSGFAYAIDPDSGKLIWKTRVGRGGSSGGIEFALAASSDSVFVGVNDFDDGHTKYEEAARPGSVRARPENGRVSVESAGLGRDVQGNNALPVRHVLRDYGNP
jgi:outer membrane protein assembly factor BamB